MIWPQTYIVVKFIGWMRGTFVCNKFPLSWSHKDQGFVLPQNIIPSSTLLFVAHWLGYVNWTDKCQCIVIVRVSSRSQDTICNFHQFFNESNSAHAIFYCIFNKAEFIKLQISRHHLQLLPFWNLDFSTCHSTTLHDDL